MVREKTVSQYLNLNSCPTVSHPISSYSSFCIPENENAELWVVLYINNIEPDIEKMFYSSFNEANILRFQSSKEIRVTTIKDIIIFSYYLYEFICAYVLSHFSHVWLCATPWTVAHQAPLSMGFSRQEYWSGFPCSPPGHLPNPGIELAPLMSPTLVGAFFTTSATWKALMNSHLHTFY